MDMSTGNMHVRADVSHTCSAEGKKVSCVAHHGAFGTPRFRTDQLSQVQKKFAIDLGFGSATSN